MADVEEGHHFRQGNRALIVAYIAVLAATALVGNYVLFITPNIELSSVTVFISGFLLGSPIGALVGFIAMSLYQLWNPLGFNLPIGVACIGCTMFTGAIGGLAGRDREYILTFKSRWNLKLGLLGVLTTLFYDFVTNYVFSLIVGWPLSFALAYGLLLSLLHVVSNGLLFGLLTPSVVRALRYLHLGAEGFDEPARTVL